MPTEIDTSPRALLSFGVLAALMVAATTFMLHDALASGPDYPALFNNSNIPAHIAVDGVPGALIPPGHTRRVGPGAAWVIPTHISCTWHEGRQGAPNLVGPGMLPVSTYITIEECLHD